MSYQSRGRLSIVDQHVFGLLLYYVIFDSCHMEKLEESAILRAFQFY